MKTEIKALLVAMIIVGALATSVFALPAFADPIAERDCSQERVRDRIRTCDADGNCNYTYAYQHRHGNCVNCPSQGPKTQVRSRAQFCCSSQNGERPMNRYGFGRAFNRGR